VKSGIKRLSSDTSPRKTRSISGHRHYVYTKPKSPGCAAVKRLKAKAKGVKTAKARCAYRSAKA
jgi:hypothetical protein